MPPHPQGIKDLWRGFFNHHCPLIRPAIMACYVLGEGLALGGVGPFDSHDVGWVGIDHLSNIQKGYIMTFPWNPDWSIGILGMAYLNPQVV